MENASKALLMAGGVLISIIIATMLMLMFNNLTAYQRNANDQEYQAEVVKFNQPYEGYNRNDVRGNDLVSLINRVIDYNTRKTTANDEAEDTYQPITITINLTDSNGLIASLSRNDKNQLFTKSAYTINGIKSDLPLNEINEITITNIEINNNNYTFTEQVLDELVTAYDKIFVSNKDFEDKDTEDKKKIFYNFNSVVGKAVFDINFNNLTDEKLDKYLKELWTSINEDSKLRENVDKYYEYVQFKRAIFNCEGIEYDENTGRIKSMNFNFTGRFNN